MALKSRTRRLSKNIKLTSGATEQYELPQDNLTRRINLHMKITAATAAGATKAVGIKNGGIAKYVKRMEVILNGSDNVFDLDLRTYLHALTYEYGASPYYHEIAIPNAGASDSAFVNIPIDFALIRNQIMDLGAVIPAQLLDSFILQITLGQPSDVFTTANATTISGTIELTLTEIYEQDANAGNQAIDDVISSAVIVREGVTAINIDAAYASYPADSLDKQIRPIPANHLTHCLVALKNITDGNPDEANDVIDFLKISNVKGGGELILVDTFTALNYAQQIEYSLENDNIEGVVYLDWVDLRNGGLANVNVDALKYELLTAAPTTAKKNQLRVYKKYITGG